MMDKNRAFFMVKRGERLGDRLVLRFPRQDSSLVSKLEECGVRRIPNQITVGYYLQLEEPKDAWCFMPVNTPAAMAVLDTRMVQDRIAYDLLSRM